MVEEIVEEFNFEKDESPKKASVDSLKVSESQAGAGLKVNYIVSGLKSHSSAFFLIAVFLGFLGASIFAFIAHNWFFDGLLFSVALLVFIFSRSDSVLKFSSFMFMLVALVLFVFYVGAPIFSVVHQNSFSPYQDSFSHKAARSVYSYNKHFAELVKSSQDYIRRQIQCAQGDCPMGQAEGPQVGLLLSTPKLMYPHKVKVGDPLDFSATLEGINLNIYPNIVIYPFCNVDGKTSFNNSNFDVSPSEIYMSDLSNGVVPITCNAQAVPSTYFVNNIVVGVLFNFTTTSDLRLVVTPSKLRNSLEEVYGNNFLGNIFEINYSQVAYYNDGPINLGMKVSQLPLAARADSNSAFLIFALNNQWRSANGAILKINYMNITLPHGLSLVPKAPYCPFVKKDSGVYVLDTSHFKLDSPVTGVLSFFCGIKVNNFNSNFPVWTPHVDVSVNYEYEMNSSNDIPLYNPNSEGSELGYSDTGFSDSLSSADFSKGCSDITVDPNNMPPSIYVKQFTSASYSSQIQRAIVDGSSKYGLPGFSQVQMAALLLGLMVAETSLGSNPTADWDGDGIPNHIAGCTGCPSGNNNVYQDIVDAAKTLKLNYETSCKDYSKYPSRLDCTLHAYHLGPNSDSDDSYYWKVVESSMTQWLNYLCSKQGGVAK